MRTVALVALVLVVSGCMVVEPPTATVQPAKSAVPASLSPSSAPTEAPTGPSTAAPTPTPGPTNAPTPSPPPPTPSASPPVVSTAGACGDDAYILSGHRFAEPYEWYFNRDSVPARLDPAEVLAVIKRAFDNITQARNDCGLPDHVNASTYFRGYTDELPCGDTTNRNVVGFGPLQGGTIALMCPFGRDTLYAHIEIDSTEKWALSEEGCSGRQELLEPTVTHEVGHVFGLDHVGERRHGDLTMSTRSNGPCHDEESTLGLGDILGLEALYGN